MEWKGGRKHLPSSTIVAVACGQNWRARKNIFTHRLGREKDRVDVGGEVAKAEEGGRVELSEVWD